MKRFVSALVAFFISIACLWAQTQSSSFERWSSDKYSMFIHFGLYSHLGGVWDGEPVRQGYSEQIQSFAGIFSDWYAQTANEFKPVNFNADQTFPPTARITKRSILRLLA